MATPPSTTPMRAAGFLDSLGVVTHLGGTYADEGMVDRLLDYTGISNIRMNAPTDAAGLSDMIYLASNGAKIDFIINGYGPVYLSNTMAMLRELKPYISIIEMPNEVDLFPITYNGLSGIDAAMKFQEDVYAAIRADHTFDGIPVYGFSIGGTPLSSYPSLRDMSASADFANVHSYAPDGIRPAWVLPPSVEGWRKIAPSDPVVVTETGYYTSDTAAAGWGAVSENVQAHYLLDTAFGNAMRGVSRTYFYDLVNDGTNPMERENNFGFFHADGTAKPVATAFHNLSTILADNAANASTFSTHAVSYAVSGLPFTAASMALEKADGTQIIAVWNEEDLWNEATDTEIASPHHKGTVTFDRAYSTVLVYDPLLSDKPIATLHDVSAVQLDVTSRPLLVQLGAAAQAPAAAPVKAPAAAPVQAPAAAPASASPAETAGPDTLTVRLSEDAFQGHAQYVVKVDGAQVGGVRTASASHAAGQTETVTVSGSWGAGQHTATVEFLNDLFTPGAGDRNLFVHDMSLNGKALADSGAVLYGNWSKTVAFEGTARDQIVLSLSEDAYKGHAQYTVTVDGVQVGGVRTASASHAAGQTEAVTLSGNWGPGPHKVSVSFLNDLYDPGVGDRNLFVDGIQFNGKAVPKSGAILYGAGTQEFAIGQRELTLRMAEDAWQGDAQFTVKVDGVQVGGTNTVTAQRSAGKTQDFSFTGPWSSGHHDVAVEFVNDAWQPGVGDRNLIVETLLVDGVAQPNTGALIYSGTAHFDAVM